MSSLQRLIDYCAAKDGAILCFPFGPSPICFKANGRIFAELFPNRDDYKITLRCDPARGEYYRATYPESIIPGYHVPLRQRKYKNTVLLDRGLDERIVFSLIDESFAETASPGRTLKHG